MTGLAGSGVTALHGGADHAGAEAAGGVTPVDADRRQAEAFQAPEGVWTGQADRVHPGLASRRAGERWSTHADHLSEVDRVQARAILDSQRTA